MKAEDIHYLLPELPANSASVLENVITECKRRKEFGTIHDLRAEILNEINRGLLIHREQKSSIARAFFSSNLRLFDQIKREVFLEFCRGISQQMKVRLLPIGCEKFGQSPTISWSHHMERRMSN
jgi:hypothetical protein